MHINAITNSVFYQVATFKKSYQKMFYKIHNKLMYSHCRDYNEWLNRHWWQDEIMCGWGSDTHTVLWAYWKLQSITRHNIYHYKMSKYIKDKYDVEITILYCFPVIAPYVMQKIFFRPPGVANQSKG